MSFKWFCSSNLRKEKGIIRLCTFGLERPERVTCSYHTIPYPRECCILATFRFSNWRSLRCSSSFTYIARGIEQCGTAVNADKRIQCIVRGQGGAAGSGNVHALLVPLESLNRRGSAHDESYVSYYSITSLVHLSSDSGRLSKAMAEVYSDRNGCRSWRQIW